MRRSTGAGIHWHARQHDDFQTWNDETRIPNEVTKHPGSKKPRQKGRGAKARKARRK